MPGRYSGIKQRGDNIFSGNAALSTRIYMVQHFWFDIISDPEKIIRTG